MSMPISAMRTCALKAVMPGIVLRIWVACERARGGVAPDNPVWSDSQTGQITR